jgi:arginase
VPSAVRLGFLDWMVTAHLLGLPEATQRLSHIGPRFPLLDPDQIVFVGAVPDELTDWEKQTVAASGLQMIWVDEVKESPARAAQKALSSLEDRVDRILAEALECIRQCVQHPKFAALTVCEFNPDHVDEEHKLVRTFVERLAATFRSY